MLIALFIILPVAVILRSALVDSSGALVLGEFVERFFSPTIWGLGCLSANTNCGVAWNTLILAVLTGLITTLLGLACALLILRTGMPGKRAMRLLTVLPIITPPFVIGLVLGPQFEQNLRQEMFPVRHVRQRDGPLLHILRSILQ